MIIPPVSQCYISQGSTCYMIGCKNGNHPEKLQHRRHENSGSQMTVPVIQKKNIFANPLFSYLFYPQTHTVYRADHLQTAMLNMCTSLWAVTPSPQRDSQALECVILPNSQVPPSNKQRKPVIFHSTILNV